MTGRKIKKVIFLPNFKKFCDAPKKIIGFTVLTTVWGDLM